MRTSCYYLFSFLDREVFYLTNNDNEIFTKKGELRKRAPKRYECRHCGLLTTKTASVRVPFAVFAVCPACGGPIKERKVYKEWYKRNTGQWEVEQKILELLSVKGPMSYEEVSQHFPEVDEDLYSQSFADLCYWGKLSIDKTSDTVMYSIKN